MVNNPSCIHGTNVVQCRGKECDLMENEIRRPISEAKKRADAKYHAKFQQVKFYCEPELYETAKSYCEEHGESLTGFIKRLMRSEIGL